MILVTGSTGTNGIEIVRWLSRVGIPCRALVRNPQKAAIFSDLPGVEVVQGDLARPETLTPALSGVDKALVCSSIGPDLVKLQGNFVRAAKEAGVPYIVKFFGDGRQHSFRMAIPALAWRGGAGTRGLGPHIHAFTTESIHAGVSSLPTDDRVRGQVLRRQPGLGRQPR